jgi:outer membrane protein assembly factor BamA
VAASFPFSQARFGQSITATYGLTNLAQNTPSLTRTVKTGLLATATLQYAYSDARRFVNSISLEEGQRFSLTFRLSDPALGSSFAFRQLSTAYAHYFRLPWAIDGRTMHHVLALRAGFGISRGDLSRRHYFDLGGFNAGDPVSTLINPANAPVRVLRGFVGGAFSGEAYALGTAEYRFPIWTPDAGPWTLPFFLRRLHGAVFTDVGDAFTPSHGSFLELLPSGAPRSARPHAGAGAELRAEVVLGYVLPTDFRLGCAHGLESSALSVLDCYAALGGIF